MVWVFGIVFLILVAIFAYWLYAKSVENRATLAKISRNRRIAYGVIGCILSFVFSFFAVLAATTISDWNQPSLPPLISILVFMVLFVTLLTGAMLCLLSLATESETNNEQKRS